jgi:hypothetical protein
MARYQSGRFCKGKHPRNCEAALRLILHDVQHALAVSRDAGQIRRQLERIETYLLHSLSNLPDEIEQRAAAVQDHLTSAEGLFQMGHPMLRPKQKKLMHRSARATMKFEREETCGKTGYDGRDNAHTSAAYGRGRWSTPPDIDPHPEWLAPGALIVVGDVRWIVQGWWRPSDGGGCLISCRREGTGEDVDWPLGLLIEIARPLGGAQTG